MTRTRVITALLLAPLAIAAVLWLPTPWLAALGATLFLAGLWEWTRMVGVAERTSRAVLVAANAGLMAALAWGGWPALFSVFALIGALWWLLAALWLQRFDFASGDGAAVRGLKLIAGTLSVVPAWCALVLLHADGATGPRWALLALGMIWAADSCAYFTGIRFGRAKLAPRVSPGKTWAGFWGGLLGGIAVALLWIPLLGLTLSQVPALMLLATVAGLASVVGDLFESLIKRHSGCKDSGDLLPGHGGVMDRIDSLLAALPVFAVGKAWLGL